MRAPVFVLLSTLAATTAAGQELALRLDPARTVVAFTLQATLHTVEGSVPVVAGEIRFDRASGQASGRVELDARRAGTASPGRDRKMHAEVLESDRYPAIVLVPNRVEVEEEGPEKVTVRLAGTLSIHGGDHPVELVAAVRREGDRIVADATLTVPYVAWGMRDPSVLLLRVAKQVEVRVHAVGTLAPMDPVPGGA
ncbi:MAG TPA: YceI family protein [Thermoanaerobaculaceae bacterium]|nr:YceI family protein [Thermoanaerobaculaceae bacterium]HRS14822.1 YceI family protein [Thermoanaerobaculaceae bacterium]